jgi:S23 ribosomal protein.
MLLMKPTSRAPRPAASHRDLIVWQKAMDLAEEVYRASGGLPASERFGLVHQMRTAAVSIASNIAEGKGRNQPRDYARFLAMARGSARELDTHLGIARRLKYLRDDSPAVAEQLLDEVGRMLTALMRRLTPL